MLPSPERLQPQQLNFFGMPVDLMRIRARADELKNRTRAVAKEVNYASDWKGRLDPVAQTTGLLSVG